MTPQTLGRYEVLGELGKGAMGVVYLARDPLIGRKLALKTFKLAYSAKDAELEQFRARFLREAQSAGILNHPNIVTIHDVVEDAEVGACFIAMEYVRGTDLKQLMQRRERLPLRFVLDIVAQIARGLDYAHGKGVVHRDVKPANIIITAERQAKITDFGIARVHTSNLTVEGQLLGTPNYMAPEQIMGREVDHRADIFSLGVMLYELITGAKPFQGDNLTMVTHRIVHEAFTAPAERVAGLPAGLAEILDRAMAKAPADRYASGAEMADDIRALLEPARPGTVATSFLDPAPAAAGAAQGPLDGTAAGPAPAAAAPPSGPSQTPSPYPLAPQPVSPPPTPGTDPTLGDILSPVSADGFGPGSGPPSSGVPAHTLAAPAAIPAPAAAPRARPPIGRWIAIGLVTAIVTMAAGTLAIWLLPGEEAFAVAPAPGAELRRRWLPLYTQGLAALEAGRPAQAIEHFERALAIMPEDRKTRKARERADRMLVTLDGENPEAAVTRRLEAGEKALARRRYQTALELAEEALLIAPRDREALALQRQAQEGLGRREQALDRFRTAPRSPQPPPPATRPPPPAVAAKGTLAVDFASQVDEGLLTVYAGQEIVLRESFEFDGGRGGTLQASRPVASGDLRLKVYLWRQGRSTEVAQLDGRLAAGASRTLRIRADADGNLTLALE